MYRFLIVLLPLVCLMSYVDSTPAGDEDKLKPTNLEKLNTASDEVDPFITADGKKLAYASNAAGTFDIYIASKSGTAWLAGKAYTPVNTKDADERSPFLSKDGVFYYATNVVPDPKFKDVKNFDLRMKEGTRASLPLLGISTKEDELFPWITANGKEFYFSRKTKEGWKQFVAQGPNPGPIKDDEPAEGIPVGFHHATLSKDGLVTYLQGPLENDRWGLYRSQRAKVGAAWAKPEPLTALNHAEGPKGDTCPCLSADDKMLYFASDRPGGMGGMDLYVIPTAQLVKGKSTN